MKLEVRSLFNKFFGEDKPQNIQGATSLKLLNTLTSSFYNFDGEIYDVDIVRSCIHTIATHAAKLKPKHLVDGVGGDKASTLERLISLRPNQYMSCYDFIYKVVSLLYTSNNVFIYIRYVDGKIEGLYPINYSSVDFIEYQNEVYVKFLFLTGQQVVIPVSELMHIRRHFNRNDMFGEDALKPIYQTLNVSSVQNQGIANAIKLSAGLRGILKFNQQLHKEDLKKAKDDFVGDYLNISNNGGVAATDSKGDYIPLELKPFVADDKQLEFVRSNIYRYYNVSEKIISSSYTEDDFNAFYSSVIEPLAIQLSQEFTSKLFTSKEIGYGNEIVFGTDRITFANVKTKTDMIKSLVPLGIMSINQAKAIFDMPDIEGGDKHIVSLNYVDLEKANKYQLGEDGDSNDNKNE